MALMKDEDSDVEEAPAHCDGMNSFSWLCEILVSLSDVLCSQNVPHSLRIFRVSLVCFVIEKKKSLKDVSNKSFNK